MREKDQVIIVMPYFPHDKFQVIVMPYFPHDKFQVIVMPYFPHDKFQVIVMPYFPHDKFQVIVMPYFPHDKFQVIVMPYFPHDKFQVIVMPYSPHDKFQVIVMPYFPHDKFQVISVRGNAVFGRYYAVFQARTPFWKLCPVPWTQFYCGQYSRFEARFSRFQCCNPFCVYERFINSNLIADAQFESPCAAV